MIMVNLDEPLIFTSPLVFPRVRVRVRARVREALSYGALSFGGP